MIEQILEADRMLQVDQVGKARDMYTRIVELDPANAIATLGLARCALADGDDHEAYGLAAKALEIDPENDMARRMEARMAEVLTVRGEQVTRPDAASAPGARQMRPMVTEESEPAPMSGDPGARPSSSASEAATPPVVDMAAKPGANSAPPLASKRRSFLDRLMGR